MNLSRRTMLKSAVAASLLSIPAIMQAGKYETKATKLKGNIRHSVSKWCYGKIPLIEFCNHCKEIGIESVELLNPEEWKEVLKQGLTCAVAYAGGQGIDKGFNQVEIHDELIASYEKGIPELAAAGLKTTICFSGRRNGVTDEQGWNNCVPGLKRLAAIAEKHNIIVVMELLNSFDHKDYLCDKTAWGVELCKRVGSPNIKLLYDIYHMQRMEGEIINTIRKNIDYIGHIHTGGNPGRNEIDETQEIYYPAVMKAIAETGYKGFVGQEFVPKGKDPIASLKKCILICDV